MANEIDNQLKRIEEMSHVEMCRHYRFAPLGDIIFCNFDLYTAFDARFRSFGGMTSAMSKQIGW